MFCLLSPTTSGHEHFTCSTHGYTMIYIHPYVTYVPTLYGYAYVYIYNIYIIYIISMYSMYSMYMIHTMMPQSWRNCDESLWPLGGRGEHVRYQDVRGAREHVRTMTTLLTGSKTSFACSVAQESPNVAQFCKVWSVWSRKHSSL